MPFDRCIAAALADQLLTPDEADHYSETFRAFERDFRAEMPPHEASAEAARETFRYIEDSAAERRRQTFLSLAAKADIEKRLADFINPVTGKEDPYSAARALYDRMRPGRNGLAVEGQHDFWRNQAQSHLDSAFDTWSRNMLGQRKNTPRLANIVREAFGERTGDNAAEMLAAGWKRASEELRQGFNRFGGHIGKLEDWGLPQGHNSPLIRKEGFEPWSSFITPLLDRSRMVDRDTGHPLDDVALKGVLNKIYTSIITDGWADRDPSSRGASALANRRADQRYLHFNDADSWLAYQVKFGEGDPINAMLGHIEGLSRDVAHMQVMGPNPRATLGWIKITLSKRAALEGDISRATAANDALDRMFATYTHQYAAPTHPMVADAVGSALNVLRSAQLGSAVTMAVPSDINFQRLARQFNGLPEMKMLATYFKQLNPLDPTHRLEAIRLGLGAEHYGQVLNQQGRYVGLTQQGHKWSRWISDRVLTVSGLSPWTTAGRHALGMDILGHTADQAGKAFGELDEPFRAMFQRYGIDAKDWDTIRATEPTMASGAPFIRPGDIMDRSDIDQSTALGLASKLADVAHNEMHFTAMTSTLASQAAMRGLDRPGSFRSILSASTSAYRTFGMGVLLSHGQRMMSLRPNPTRMASYGASLIIGSMIAGAMTVQTKEIIAGRDPRDMSDWRFWASAFTTGGGGGLLADYIYAGLQGKDAAGESITEALAGPLAALVQDASTALFSSKGMGAASNHPSATAKNLPTRLLEFTKRYMPGGNIWYSRLLMERYVWDQLQELTDPGWASRGPRIERWYRQNFGNEYWWPHGDTLPARAPSAAAITGSPQ